MKWTTGTGLAVGAIVTAGAPLAALSQGAASADALGTTSSANAAEHHLQVAGTALDGIPAAPAATTGQGPSHAAAMKAWARCVNAAARGPRTVGEARPAKTVCGPKPLGPGRLVHQAPTTTVPVPTGADTTSQQQVPQQTTPQPVTPRWQVHSNEQDGHDWAGGSSDHQWGDHQGSDQGQNGRGGAFGHGWAHHGYGDRGHHGHHG